MSREAAKHRAYCNRCSVVLVKSAKAHSGESFQYKDKQLADLKRSGEHPKKSFLF